MKRTLLLFLQLLLLSFACGAPPSDAELAASEDEVVATCTCDFLHTGPNYDTCCRNREFCSRDGVCTADRGVGGSCNRDAQCMRDLACVGGVCRDLIDGPGGPNGPELPGGGTGQPYICHADPSCALCNLAGDECLITYNPN